MNTLSEPPIWCDIVDRPLSVPIFLTPYMSAVRELVSGGVAIHDISGEHGEGPYCDGWRYGEAPEHHHESGRDQHHIGEEADEVYGSEQVLAAEPVGEEAYDDYADHVEPLHEAEGKRGDAGRYAEINGEWNIVGGYDDGGGRRRRSMPLRAARMEAT